MTITLEDVEIDLNKIGIDFIPNLDQINALEHFAKFLGNKDSRTTVLSGSAGTGKSSIAKILIEYISRTRKYAVLAAPTHKAKSVLNRLSGTDSAITIHKLLDLKANVSIEEYDAKDLLFLETTGKSLLASYEVLLIDECSMINDAIYDLIVKRLGNKGKVIFLGELVALIH